MSACAQCTEKGHNELRRGPASSASSVGEGVMRGDYGATVMRVAALAWLLALSAAVPAQEWPVRPVRIIVPFPPGQGADIIGRLLAERLTPILGQQTVVENRTGAGSMVGTSIAAKAPADGYTLLIGGSSAMVINPHLYPNPGYDTLRDFAPITNIASLPMVICVNASFPAKTIPDLIRIAKQRPDEISYGSSGNGSTHHILQAMFVRAAGIKATHVPYKGAAASMSDLIGGRIVMLADTLPATVPHIKAGKVRALGISSIKRSPFLPDVPTLDEQGIKGFNVIAWAGLFSPAGVSAPILDRLNNEVVRLLNTPATQNRFQELTMTTIGDSRADFDRFVKAELASWGKAVKASGAKID
ncbi:MAG: tripartite tricarboxylate transporter substrate binding protein [Betaproteobacteria bacterium]|nr:tripartite tricarboxylate transporter substrate binding protein [Betaproteobacteria bacterium]